MPEPIHPVTLPSAERPIRPSYPAKTLLEGVAPIGYTFRPLDDRNQPPRPIEEIFNDVDVEGVPDSVLSWQKNTKYSPKLQSAPRELEIHGRKLRLSDKHDALGGGMAAGLIGEFVLEEETGATQKDKSFVRFIPVVPQDQNRPQQLQRLLRELSILDHIHALQGIKLLENQSGQLTLCMVVKAIPGQDLGKIIKDIQLRQRYNVNRHKEKPRISHPLPIQEGADDALLMQDLCINLLADAHRGIMHRDTKPANIMVVPRTPGAQRSHHRFVDYGIAKAFSDQDATHSVNDLNVAAMGPDAPTVQANLTDNFLQGTLRIMTSAYIHGNPNDPYINLVGAFSGLLDKWQLISEPEEYRHEPTMDIAHKKIDGKDFSMSRLDTILWPQHKDFHDRTAENNFPLTMRYEDVADQLTAEFGKEFPHEAMRKMIFIAYRVVRISVMLSERGMPVAFSSEPREHESEYIGVVRNLTKQMVQCAQELNAAVQKTASHSQPQ